MQIVPVLYYLLAMSITIIATVVVSFLITRESTPDLLKKFFSSSVVPVLFALITALFAIFVLMGDSNLIKEVLGSTIPTSQLVYKIHIEEQELLGPVANSQVIIEIDGQAAAIATSDSNGLSVLVVDSSLAGQPASLIVKATGYAIHIEDVELTVGGLPEVVGLKPEPEAIKEPDRN